MGDVLPGDTLHGSGAEIPSLPTTALTPQSSTPFLATSAIPPAQRFPIVEWSPPLKLDPEARLQHEKEEDRPTQNNLKGEPRQRARGAGIHVT